MQSPRKIGKKIFLSPMKAEEAMKLSMTPRSSQLYCFGDLEGPRQLENINNSIRQFGSPSTATKRLTFEEPDASYQRDTRDISVSTSKKIKFNS
ncbi:hypothetical protein EB796_023159 [Bugula neritina]|uniref:Uncharacterized protein n=1 Tax=Bugula neritina TaxID=10212 RepID=A0A7J7IXI0_BUGNE|nr:hypothetical protein EB796_023159 [Bugula neritina]